MYSKEVYVILKSEISACNFIYRSGPIRFTIWSLVAHSPFSDDTFKYTPTMQVLGHAASISINENLNINCVHYCLSCVVHDAAPSIKPPNSIIFQFTC